MRNRYGLPYMGSKNAIAPWVLSYIPKAENFYDLFCGGCAITHCAIETGKYNNLFINDINGALPHGFLDCINGKYRNDFRWISHEDFDAMKGKGDLLVDICFSFGNNYMKGYAYSREIEPFKKAVHYYVCFGDGSLFLDLFGICLPDSTNTQDAEFRMSYVKKLIGRMGDLPQHLSSLDRLQSLERLFAIDAIRSKTVQRSVSNIHASTMSYDLVPIKPNSVIYCDIPYRSTAQYNDAEFDYEKFYDWCSKQTAPTFISEYDMPLDKFVCIGAKRKQVLLCSKDNSKSKIEKLFIPIHQAENKPLTLF